MKIALKVLFLLCVAVPFALAQLPQGITNIIVVVQENRTPDNLFQDPNLVGADLATGGLCKPANSKQQYPVPLTPVTLPTCYDIDHSHGTPGGAWVKMYDSGGMDGACNEVVKTWGSCTVPACPPPNQNLQCPAYQYVSNSDGFVGPYWKIAETFGYANYMFQTNQGPSFPAHQFLLSGTSAPTDLGYPTPDYTFFAAENPNNNVVGCAASSNTTVNLIEPSGSETTTFAPCFEHPTLTDLLEANGVGWLYYGDQANSIWTAPNAISHICLPLDGNGNCQGPAVGATHEFTKHVITEQTGSLAPFMNALSGCNVAYGDGSQWQGGVIWVIPDGRWSDHAGQAPNSGNIGLGPDYVANIVNLLGRSSGCPSPMPNWSNTVLLITWDDWGGWYDHVNPETINGNNFLGYPNNTAQEYVYGFRVPLLVVSTYAKQQYVSGPKGSPIYHDFGSILRFIEEEFLPKSDWGGIYNVYPYADAFAGGNGVNPDNLGDFFRSQAQSFPGNIALHNDSNLCNQTTCKSNACDATCFINYTGNPKDPDID